MIAIPPTIGIRYVFLGFGLADILGGGFGCIYFYFIYKNFKKKYITNRKADMRIDNL